MVKVLGRAAALAYTVPPQSPFEPPTNLPKQFYGGGAYMGIGRAAEPLRGRTKRCPCSEHHRKFETAIYWRLEGFQTMKLTRLEKSWQAWTGALSAVGEWPFSVQGEPDRLEPKDIVSILVRACDRGSEKKTHWKIVEYIGYLADTYGVERPEWIGSLEVDEELITRVAARACYEVARPERRLLGPYYNFERKEGETAAEAKERSSQERKEWKTLLSRLHRLYQWSENEDTRRTG